MCGQKWFRRSVEEKNLFFLQAIQWFLRRPACGLDYLDNDFLFIVEFCHFPRSVSRPMHAKLHLHSCIKFSHVNGYLDDDPK